MKKSWMQWVWAILACFLFSTLYTAITFEQSAGQPWDYLNDDHIRLGTWYHKLQEPDLYAEDYYHYDFRFIESYPPSYFTIINIFAPDNLLFEEALAYSQFTFLFIYLLITVLLLFLVSKSLLLSLVIAFISTSALWAFGLLEHWNLVGLGAIMTRYYAFPLMMFIVLVWIWQLRHPKPRFLIWVGIGILLGIITNLHPTTGLTISATVGIASLLWWIRVRNFPFGFLIGLGIATIIFASPMVLFRTSSLQPVDTDLSTNNLEHVRETLADNMRALSATNFLNLRGFNIDDNIQIIIAWLWMIVSGITWFMTKVNQRSIPYLIFMLLQAFIIWIITDIPTPVVIAIVGYFIWQWNQMKDETFLFPFELVATIGVVTLILPIIAFTIWDTFQVWSLRGFDSQFARGSKLLNIPVLFLALHMLVQQIRFEKTLWSLRNILVIVFVMSLFLDWYFAIPMLVIFLIQQRDIPILHNQQLLRAGMAFLTVALSAFVMIRLTFALYWQITVISSLVFAVVITGIWWLNRQNPQQSHYITLGVVILSIMFVVGLIVYPQSLTDNSRNFVQQILYPSLATLVLGGIIGLGLSFTKLKTLVSEQGLVIVGIVGMLLIQNLGQQIIDKPSQPIDPHIEVALWARENLSKDTVVFPMFMFESNRRIPVDFRYWSRLPITHARRDRQMITTGALYLYPAYLDRYNDIIATYDDPDLAIQTAIELGANYILSDNQQYPLDLPVAYQNGDFRLYDLQR